MKHINHKPSFLLVWIFFHNIFFPGNLLQQCCSSLSFETQLSISVYAFSIGIFEHIIRKVAKMWELMNLLSCGISEILKLLQHRMFQDLTRFYEMYLLGYVPHVVCVCFQLREMSSLLFLCPRMIQLEVFQLHLPSNFFFLFWSLSFYLSSIVQFT